MIGKILAWSVQKILRHSLAVVLLFIPLTGGALWYTLENLKLKTDYTDLISDDLPFHARWVEYKEEFPQVTDTLVIVFEGLSPAENLQIAAQFKEKLSQNKELFSHVFNLSSPGESQAFLEVRPKLDYSELLPGEKPISYLKTELEELEIQHTGLNVSLTGAAALAYEEMQNIAKSIGWASALSILVTALIFGMALGSFRITFMTMIGLVVGLVFTGAFAALSIGYLNMISIAFAVLFIGLGLDYSLHLFLRYRELRADGISHRPAMIESIQEVGQSLWLCAITTCAGFYAFIPTSYKGVAELGIISGTGMFINFFIQVTLLPALINLWPHKEMKALKPNPIGQWLNKKVLSYFKFIRWGTLVVGLISLFFTLQLRFDPNPLSLQDPTTEALQTFEKLMKDSERSPWTIKVLENDFEKAQKLVAELEKKPEVSEVMWLGGFPYPPEYLPDEIKQRFVNEKGVYRIEVFPKENMNDVDAMRRFANAVLPLAPQATDDPVTIPLTADAVVQALIEAGLLALLFTLIILLFSLRSFRDSLLALTPLILGGLITLMILELSGQNLNFANIIVLPLLLGIAMDSGIHVITKYRKSARENPIAGSTSRALFFSALVNVTSFGTLAFAEHRGMSSMGVLLSVGLALMLLCTFVILPAFLKTAKS